MRTRVALAASLAVALAGTPRSQAEGDSREAQLRAEIVSIEPALPGEPRWALFAHVIGDADRTAQTTGGRAQVAAGGELSLASDLCDLVRVGGQLQLYHEGGDAAARQGASGEQWASACLFSGSGLPLIEIGHRLELSLRPALDSRLGLRADRYSRETVELRMVGLNYEDRDLRVEISSWRTVLDFVWQPGHADDLMTLRTNVNGAVFRWVRPGRGLHGGDRALGILPIDMRMTITGSDATTARVGPVRLEQYRLGSLPLYLDADLAWASGSVWALDEGSGQYASVVQKDMLAADAALQFGAGAHTAGLRYERSLFPTVELELVAEDRLSAWSRLQLERAGITLNGFAARSKLLAAAEQPPIATGGIRATLEWPLGAHLQASLNAEVARSFYAVLDGDEEHRAAWAARLLGALSTHFGAAN